MRQQLLEASLKYAEGQLAKHKANVEVYLTYPTGIGEHSDILGAIEVELNAMSTYEEQIGLLKKYFIETKKVRLGILQEEEDNDPAYTEV